MSPEAPHSEPYSDAVADDARWMTFAELAAARGVSKRAAVTLVRRHKWRRQRNNEGLVLALVPAAWASCEATSEPAGGALSGAVSETHGGPHDTAETGAYAATFETALAAIEAAHAGELAAVRNERDAAERARLAAQAIADQALVQLSDAQAALAAERAQTDKLRDQLDAAEASAEQAEARGDRAQVELERARAAGREALQAAEALRRAEAERKARGLVARLRAAWRGG